MVFRFAPAIAVIGLLALPAFAQQQPAPQPARVLGIIPNFRTSASLEEYKPLRTRDKFKISAMDSFDRGTFALGALFAGEAQLTASNPSFGQGVRGYGHYFVTSYADYAIGDYMTEAILPTAFHQDPRYFRRGSGGGWARLGYATGQIFITHGDSGRTQINVSEIGGNAAAVAISMSYYPENRDAGTAASKLGSQIAVDLVSNVLKEFWPDITRTLSRHR